MGVGLSLGVGSGVAEADGAGTGTGVGGPAVYPSNEGSAKSSTGRSAIACVMKSCQICAGMVPPNTAE
jgi:hypothetical protein